MGPTKPIASPGSARSRQQPSSGNSSFRELICQGMAPSMLHVLGELSTTSMDMENKGHNINKLLRHPKYSGGCS